MSETSEMSDVPATKDRSSLLRKLEPLVWIFAIVSLLFVFGKATLDDPTQTAATRDPAWYTWRSGVIVSGDPGTVVEEWGPFSMFSGGYRVSVPVSGALLQNVAGTQQITFPGFLMVGIPILAGLAFAAGAWRSTKDPFLSVLIMFVTGVFFLTTPYVGYLDNLFVLFILGSLIAFLEPARTSWGARSALFMLALLAMFTHPTTCVIFLGTMFAVVGFHLLSMKFKIRQVIDRDLPALLPVFLGMIFGALLWPLGELLLWGHAGNLIDSALPPPYETSFFVERLAEWIGTQFWMITVPLAIVAIAWIAGQSKREGKPADAFRTMSAWWLLPYAATALTYFMGKPLPYYRFMNSTAAIMTLVAIGIWVIARWILKQSDGKPALKAVTWALTVGVLGFVFVEAVGQGWEATKWNDPANQWVDQDTRAAMASVAAVAASDPERPLVFVNNYKVKFQAYGWSKTYSNASRSSLPSGVGARAFQYFGDLPDYLADQRTITEESCNEILEAEEVNLTAITGGKKTDEDGVVIRDEEGIAEKLPQRPECTYDLVSRGFFDEMHVGLDANGETPFVFMVKGFNGEAGNDSENLVYWTEEGQSLPEFANLNELGPNVFLVQSELSESPSEDVLGQAREAGAAEAASLAAQQAGGPLDNPGHILRVLFGLFLLLVLPGLIAANWFGLDKWQLKLGLVPIVSIAMNILMAILVISVTRSSYGTTSAWITIGLSTLTAIVLNFLARRRKDGPGKVGGKISSVATYFGNMIEDMGAPFRNYESLKALLTTQFFSQAGDGVIQGTIFAKLLNPSEGRSAIAILGIIFLTYLPFAFVAPVTGVISDRYDRRAILVFANIARVVIVLAMAALLFIGLDNDYILITLLLLVLGGARLVLLVKGAGLADAAGGKDLLMANSLSQMGGAVFQIGGFVVGAVVVTLLPKDGVAVATAAALYLTAYYFTRGIKRIEKQEVEGSLGQAVRGVFGKIGSGLREVASKPPAAIGILSFWLTRTLLFGFVGLLGLFQFAAILQANPGESVQPDRLDTIIAAFFGVLGAVISLFLVKRVEDRVPPAIVLRTAMYVAGAFGLLVPVGDALGFGLIAKILSALFAGIAFFLVKVSADTLTQRALPDDFRGRAYALFDIAYALSYAVPAGILYFFVIREIPLELAIALWGLLVIVSAAALNRWARRSGMSMDASDDLTEKELATGHVDE